MKKTKKGIAIFLAMLILLLQFSSVVLANNDENLNNLEVKNIITDYFKTELESINQNKIDKDIISNPKVKEYQTTYTDFLSQWYQKSGVKLTSYNIEVNIKSISYDQNKTNVSVSTKTDMIFDVAPNIVQKSVEDYIFVLKKDGSNWKIDNFNKSNEESFNLDTEIIKIKDNMKDMDSAIKKIKQPKVKNAEITSTTVTPSLTSTVYFNRIFAVDYAHNYYYIFNPNFPNLDPNDCTNFVSQAWNYGGIPQSTYWKATQTTYTRAWAVVDDFRNYMINNGYAYHSTSNSDVQLADIIQFYNATKGTWSHAAITSYIDSYHNLYYTAHSTSRYDYGLYNVYPSSTYPAVRYVCMYNF